MDSKPILGNELEDWDDDEDFYPCPECGGSGCSIEGWDCEECDGLGYWE